MTKVADFPMFNQVHAERVLGVIEGFLKWCEGYRAPLTYRWYRDRLQSFCRSLSGPGQQPSSERAATEKIAVG